MPDESNISVQAEISVVDGSTSHLRARRLYRIGIVVAVFGLLLGLFFLYAPRYLARYLVTAELDALGISHEGVETLDINPWTRELWLGPVRFGGGPSDRGQVGELGLRFGIKTLLERRVFIERLLLRGIDVVVERSTQDELTLNGIPLERLIPPPGAVERQAERGDAWGAGVDIFELRDSQLIFQDRERGVLKVEVDRLALMEFQTWEPERPGRFELAARVNDIQLNWSGEARPFADNITLAIDSRTEQADVPKVVRFTGPWGLDRRDGTYGAQLKYQVTISDSGRLEGHTAGTIEINGADYARSGVFALELERAKVDLDVRYAFSESGDLSLQGQVVADLGSSSAVFADETRVAVAAGRVALNEIDAQYASGNTLKISGRPDVDLESAILSGSIDISVDNLLELLVFLQSLSTAKAASAADTGLADLAGRSLRVPASDVKIGRLTTKGESFSLQSTGSRVELGLKTATDLADIEISANQRHITIEHFQSVIERLSVTSGQGRLAVDTAGKNSLVAGAIRGSRGEIKIDALEAQVAKLDAEAQVGTFALQLAAATQARGFSGVAHAEQALPEIEIKVGAARAALTQASLRTQSGVLRWKALGDAAAESLTASFANGEAGAARIGRAEIKALQATEPLQLAADTLTIDGADLSVTRSLLKALLRGGGAATEKGTASRDAADKPRVAAPASTPDAAKQKVDVRRVQTLLTDLGYAPGPVDGRMGRRTAAAIREFQTSEVLNVDGRLTSRLLAALEARAAPPAASDAAPAPSARSVAAPKPTVRLQHIAFTGDPVLRFRDDMMTPNVTIETVFKELKVENLDTEKTDQRTQLSVIADVDEHTQVAFAGWIAGPRETADLEIKAKAENLQLSTYSPYVAELAGVHLDSGRLDAAADASAARGRLQGEIRLKLADIAFRPLSKADAERVTSTVGVPLETAVDLLEDVDGRIALTLPITGTMSEPDVDISPAINKAIGGALTKVFPPTMVASMIAGLVKGGGPAFEPIEFTPGSPELNAAANGYARSVAKLLAERPELSLKVCGRSTAQDMDRFLAGVRVVLRREAGRRGRTGDSKATLVPNRAQAEQAMTELAVERQRNVRRYLIKQKGVDAERVSECRSTFDGRDQGRPRVEISL